MDCYGVMGNPIQHSKSPLIHRLFAEETHQDLLYNAILVPPDQLASALSDFQSQKGRGLNITAPFKQSAFALVDAVSPRALRAGSVNTIRFDADGVRFGDNTDGVGLVRDITLNQQISLKNKSVLLLGAGGAVSGVLEAVLNEQPAIVTIANRTEEKALALIGAYSDRANIRCAVWSALSDHTFDVVINGTSAGLQAADMKLPNDILNLGAYCYDMVYGVGVTAFYSWVRAQNSASYSDGLGMLVEQAAESFYIWRQIRPNTQAVLAFLRESH
jgi:shikimate dehydrogenase